MLNPKTNTTPQTYLAEQAPEGYRGKHAAPKVKYGSRGYRQHAQVAGSMFLQLPNGSREAVMGKRSYNELITHDGSKTYLVHSTTPYYAQKIMQNGLEAIGTADDPNLEFTVVALAGPDDKDQAAKNAFNLSYQYTGGEPEERTAKVIFEIDKPTPDITLGNGNFHGTHLGRADGKNIIDLGPAVLGGAGYDRQYVIPGNRAMGYIDSAHEMSWVSNPNFNAPPQANLAEAAGSLAVGAVHG
jgi:hypothetical protein